MTILGWFGVLAVILVAQMLWQWFRPVSQVSVMQARRQTSASGAPHGYQVQPTGRITEVNACEPDGNVIEFHLEGDQRTFWVEEDDSIFLDIGECFDRRVPIAVLDWHESGKRVQVLEITEVEEDYAA